MSTDKNEKKPLYPSLPPVGWTAGEPTGNPTSTGASSSLLEAADIVSDLTKSLHQMLIDPKDPKTGGTATGETAAGASSSGSSEEDFKSSYLRTDSVALDLHKETDISKILKGWPEKDCPKFTGAVGEDANDWLVTMGVLLGDRQAHPALWHVAAGQRCENSFGMGWQSLRGK
ncbi:uncharacterized protein PGTG_08895 [Puccinia graminis f. sp. tritici CRL 75-36-700-3]|uniref:Uncharacterized protein n=1 Tax=Puccinia graminis f. sp. tritici (strain CRL 75-36-700-3 / race SCCL) TaxID=418459 RepID=E3KEG6_PUCGT|nr:uncharacterized protein PGTG_08895 [Puccinia graminis f. sp. tritici CRL 75-36-700-3]EFP82699.1 hypothetical protein PGTG_08895 [Puccinia graminis f. sp. tritici CRL 75-36-700-3]